MYQLNFFTPFEGSLISHCHLGKRNFVLFVRILFYASFVFIGIAELASFSINFDSRLVFHHLIKVVSSLSGKIASDTRLRDYGHEPKKKIMLLTRQRAPHYKQNNVIHYLLKRKPKEFHPFALTLFHGGGYEFSCTSESSDGLNFNPTPKS